MRSMRIFLLFSFNALLLLEAYLFTNETDMQALLEFKSGVSEGKRVVLSSWNHSFPLCNWNGVTCGRKHKRVTRLDLGGLKLGGVISPSIGNLSFLIYLNLTDNYFGGSIPQEVGNLFRLEYLNVSNNNLGGVIPASLSNCSRLSELYILKNHLQEGVPPEIGLLKKLRRLDVSENNLKGKLPPSIGNLTSLVYVEFGYNHIEGEVPDSIARLTQIKSLGLAINNFSGVFPRAIYNLSSLEYLYVAINHFSGSLRKDFGNLLPNLREFNMGNNYLTGVIPTTLTNITTLQKLGMNNNNLTGTIPPGFGNLGNLQWLLLYSNSLRNYPSGDVDFFVSLTNCTKLETLMVGENKLEGDLTTFIANLSTNLINLELGTNFISGSIPNDITNLKSLQTLWLQKNMLTGALPTSLDKLLELGVLCVSFNRMSGEIPFSIGNIPRLERLQLSSNYFEGTVPSSLGNCRYLLLLDIGGNKLNGTIPQEIMEIRSLTELFMSSNSLIGSLPNNIGRLQNLVALSLENNNFSGQLPKALGSCLAMEKLLLRGNSFDGAIPNMIGLVGVKKIDLSRNRFSGSIPEYLSNFSKLEYLNLSINNLEGKVPTEGIFKNATIVSLFGNKNLCGGIKDLKLKPCLAQAPPLQTKHSSLLKRVVIGVSTSVALLLMLFIAFVSLHWSKKRKDDQQINNPAPSTLEVFHEKISYRDLRTMTDGFSSSNLIGSGNFGTVFKALFPTDNKVVAVKVLNLQRRGAMKSFMAECESLKIIRHRNLVKLVTACSSIDFQGNDFRALIYEFMPNGSLDMWLHPEEVEEIGRPSKALTLLERLNVVIDVASVLDYLHVHCHEPIAHCDLKPSNVLLDDDLTAHVSDFGLARLLLKFDAASFLNQLSSAGVRGTIGYAAPEYGMGGQPSTHGDVYSFGVLILEMFTGKRPTDELFGGNFTLYSYTKSALPERVLDIADVSILQSGLRVGFPVSRCLTMVFDVGLRCCEESPEKRLAMSEATKELISIKEGFFPARRTARS